MLPVPSHSTDISDAGTSIDGGVVSSIVNVALVVDALPQSSAASNTAVMIWVDPHPATDVVS
jgi:hypothetical protein